METAVIKTAAVTERNCGKTEKKNTKKNKKKKKQQQKKNKKTTIAKQETNVCEKLVSIEIVYRYMHGN